MPHSTSGPQSVDTRVPYHNPPPKGEAYPVQYVMTVGFARQKHNWQPVKATDIRTVDDTFSLDKQGFEIVPSTIRENEWQGNYRWGLPDDLHKDVQELVMRHSGATYVHPFAPHVIRKDTMAQVADIPEDALDTDPLGLTPPAQFIHVDQSYDGAQIVLDALPEADQLRAKTAKRWGIINVWQPLGPVTREPLAMIDARTVDESDLRPVTTRVVLPGGRNMDNEQWHCVANPNHRWYYASGMGPGEALLIKNYDTKLDGTARRVPHTAIKTPGDDGPPRRSIEIRCLVFWEDQEKE